jgi:energy-coupling factor transporter ATP-binding protein EcfA2
MKLLSLSITRMPGIDQRISIDDLDSQFNVILGANASGKSSLCRAAQGLLWPATYPKDSYWVINSLWKEKKPIDGESKGPNSGNDIIEIAIDGRAHRVLQYGSQRPALPVPSDTLRDCYLIALEDLFLSDGSALASAMFNEMAGGFNIHEVKDNPPIRQKKVHSERKQLQLAQATYKAISKQQQLLKQSEANLTQKKQRLLELQKTASFKDNIDDAIRICRLKREAEERAQLLVTYPDGLDALHGNELEELEEIQKEITDLERAEAASRKTIATSENQLSNLKLPEHGVSETTLQIHIGQLSNIHRISPELTQHRRAIKKLEHELQLGSFSESPHNHDKLTTRTPQLEQLATLALSFESVCSKQTKLSMELSLLERLLDENLLDSFSSDDYQEAVAILNKLLEQRIEDSQNAISLVTIASLLLLFALSIGGGLLIDQRLYGISGIGIALLFLVLQPLVASRAKRSELIADVLSNPILSEKSISEGDDRVSLIKLLGELDKVRANSLESEARRRSDEQRYQLLQHELDEAVKSRAVLEAECHSILSDLGLNCSLNTFEISDLSRELKLRAEQFQYYRELRSTYDVLKLELDDLLRRVSDGLVEYGYSPCSSPEEAEANINDLRQRSNLQRETRIARDNAKEALSETESRLEKYLRKREDIYKRAKLAAGAKSELEQRLDLRRKYLQIKQEESENRGKIAMLTEKLNAQASHLLEKTTLELESESADAETALAQYQELRDEIVRIETEIRATREGRSLEDAANEVGKSRAQLEAVAMNNARAALCSLLLKQVQDEHLNRNRPEVFTESSRLFSLFTHGRYELSGITPDGPRSALRVFDNHQGASLELAQLSSGTKAQILLACKVAFAQSLEHGDPLPLLFDEALSTSDPLRFRAVIDGLCTLAREGRQILYFTSQPNDTHTIENICREQACTVAVHTISKEIESIGSPLLTASTALDSIPEPDERPYHEYAELLGIEPISLVKGSSAIHIGHLTENKQLLHSLVGLGIKTFGQLQNFISLDESSTYISQDAYRQMAARHRLIDSSFSLWKIGRGEPLTLEIIQEALPKTKLRENILEIFRQTKDNKLFIDSIDPGKGKAVPRFKPDQFERLRDALLESGNFSEASPLTEEEFHNSLLNEVAADVKLGLLQNSEAARLTQAMWQKLSRNELL